MVNHYYVEIAGVYKRGRIINAAEKLPVKALIEKEALTLLWKTIYTA